MLRYCTSSCTSSLRKRRRSGALSVHTGTIDNAWRLLKQAVPKSLASKKGHTYNPALIKHCRSWQWRWKNTGTSLFQKTAKVLNETVQSRWLSLAIEKNARRNVLKPAYFKKTAKKSLMNAENIAKRTKKAKTQWHGEYHELNCLPKPCVSHPMSRIWTPKTDKTWVQFPTRPGCFSTEHANQLVSLLAWIVLQRNSHNACIPTCCRFWCYHLIVVGCIPIFLTVSPCLLRKSPVVR